MRQASTFGRGAVVALIATIGGALALAGCGGSSDSSSTAAAGAGGGSSSSSAGGGTQLALVAYSTPKKAYDALTSAFGQTSAGKGISFSQSFGASGSQSRAVDSGQPADVVAFSTTPDVTRLVTDKIVSANWDAGAQKGISSDSVVVLVVRKGNPKHITGWDDLIKPGVDVITPNPSTSGSARWNILAAYGAQLKEGKSPAQALAYVNTLLTKNVSVQDSSASAALQTFTGGKGDVLLDYESDAIAAQKAGDSIQYLVPKQTILIETPIAVTSKSSHAAQAQAFLNWQWSPAGQTIWAQQGYRPVVKSVFKQFAAKFPTPPQLFTIDFLGGWTKVKTAFFDPAAGSITKIEQAAGVPTATK
ncbi:MAG: sulfate/thiosulfate transport system substrate-binding protein [Solirubrobacteraceae bacterium]|jgi:sulfate transport system substrate-binding protein|nr:sulfate/thiosulfate transport system substrate-binding protein [Solirubrobacteraceae bacterium]